MPAAKAGPTYAAKVTEAITELKSKKGSSLQAITANITAKHGPVNKTALSQALKKGVADGEFMKVKASYKLSKTAKATVVKKKKPVIKKVAAVKKVATTTKPKKSITKKKTTTTKKTSPKIKKTSTKKTPTKKTATKKKTTTKKK